MHLPFQTVPISFSSVRMGLSELQWTQIIDATIQ